MGPAAFTGPTQQTFFTTVMSVVCSCRLCSIYCVGLFTSGCGQRSPQTTQDAIAPRLSDVRRDVIIALLEQKIIIARDRLIQSRLATEPDAHGQLQQRLASGTIWLCTRTYS